MENRFTQYIFIVCLWCCISVLYTDVNNIQSALVKTCGVFILVIIELINNLIEKYNKPVYFLELLYCLFLIYAGIDLLVYILPIIIYNIFYGKFNKHIIYVLSFCFIYLVGKEMQFNNFLYIIFVYFMIDLTTIHYEYVSKLKLKNRTSRYRTYDLEKRLFFLDRYMEESRKVVLLKERNYIAQKLHDSLGHRITGSLMQLQVTKEMMDTDLDLSKRTLDNAVNNLSNGMDQIRLFLRNVKPMEKDINITDLRELLDKYQYQTSIKTNLRINGSIKELKGVKFNTIYENIRELLTNTAKYSEATEVKIDIDCYEDYISTIVRDNGQGYKNMKKGLGLKGIEERMDKIDGKVNFYSDNGFKAVMIVTK